jgi:TolA-binding protein
MNTSISRRLVFFLVNAVAVAGCASLPSAEQEQLRLAASQYVRGDSTAAVQKLDRIIRDYPRAAEIAEAYYIRGLCHARSGRADAAKQDLRKAISDGKREDLVADAQASLAGIAYKEGDWSTAANYYADAIKGLPDSPPKDQIHYHAGVAMQRSGQWRQAQQQFAMILFKFRQSSVAAPAQRQAAWKHEFFSIQVGAFSSTAQADKAIEGFRAKGLDTFQEFSSPDGGAKWLVLSGRYTTWAEAQAALARVRRVQADAYIVP